MPKPAPIVRAVDRWTVWYNRVSQVLAWAVVGYEVTGPVDHFVLLFAAAMMLGPLGLRILIKGIIGLVGETTRAMGDEIQQEESHET